MLICQAWHVVMQEAQQRIGYFLVMDTVYNMCVILLLIKKGTSQVWYFLEPEKFLPSEKNIILQEKNEGCLLR